MRSSTFIDKHPEIHVTLTPVAFPKRHFSIVYWFHTHSGLTEAQVVDLGQVVLVVVVDRRFTQATSVMSRF